MEMDTKAVLDHHFAAFAAADTDEVLKDYNEESILITPEATHKGRQAIRAFFSDSFSGLFKPGTYELTPDTLTIEGDVGYVVWHATCASADIPLATDTWIVRDGKVAVQTFAAKIDPK
jgi:ketosteroid isomerase-like protein